MQTQKTDQRKGQNSSSDASRRKMLPFLIEFIKFSTGFAIIVATALLTLHYATTRLRVEQLAF